MQPKKYENPKIALLNVELELKAEKENAEVRVDNVEVNAFSSLSRHLWEGFNANLIFLRQFILEPTANTAESKNEYSQMPNCGGS